MPELGGRFASLRLPLRTPRLILRLPRPSDVQGLSRAGDDPRVSRWTFVPSPFTPTRARSYIGRLRRRAKAGEGLTLLVEEARSGEVLGLVGLSVNPTDPSAFLFYWISPRSWGQGLGSEAVRSVLGLAFGPLGMHRVGAHVFASNLRSRRLLRRAGFREEGRAREVRREGGRWQAELAFGLLDREFRARGRSRSQKSPARAKRPSRSDAAPA